MKVTIGTVHGSEINSWYHHSIVGLLVGRNPTDHQIKEDHICVRSGPLLSAGRGILAGKFLEQSDSDALLMIDADMSFTPARIYEHVETFAKCRAQYPNMGVLGGLTWIGSDPYSRDVKPNLWAPGKHQYEFIQANANDVPPDALVEVPVTGAACLMIAREVLQKFADERINPFHHIPLVNWAMLARNIKHMDTVSQIEAEMRYAVMASDQCGEDMSFCIRVREAGWRIFVHTALDYGHAKSTLLGKPGLHAQEAR